MRSDWYFRHRKSFSLSAVMEVETTQKISQLCTEPEFFWAERPSFVTVFQNPASLCSPFKSHFLGEPSPIWAQHSTDTDSIPSVYLHGASHDILGDDHRSVCTFWHSLIVSGLQSVINWESYFWFKDALLIVSFYSYFYFKSPLPPDIHIPVHCWPIWTVFYFNLTVVLPICQIPVKRNLSRRLHRVCAL
jgi:hypothetical protein